MEYLSADKLRQIELEIGITRNTLKDDLAIIRNWVNQQPHLPNLEGRSAQVSRAIGHAETDDDETNEWLYKFLFHSKNRIEMVKQHMEAYFTFKTLMPEFFSERDPEAEGIKSNVRALYLVTLPRLTPEGYRIHIFRHALPDPDAYNPTDFMRRALMMCEWKIKSDTTAGDIIIMHMKHSSLAHWGRYNLVTLSRFVAAITKAYQFRIKAIHFVQAPSFIGRIINNPLIPSKIKQRITVHSGEDMTSYLKDIPKHCIPVELGGTLNVTLKELNESTYRNLVDMKTWLRENEKLKSDESKRTGEANDNSLFGCSGTFRKLEID